ncbi:MAG: alpha-amylase [Bacteroidetes bacterium]|nr:alpha-amylase [Bacteroidota bacterium]
MRSICFYFQVHQPFRLRTYRFFDMGVDHYYYNDFQNKSIIQRIAQKCYLPANELMLQLIKKHGKSFNIAYSLSGLALEQFEKYTPDVIRSFKKLAATGNVEFLTETYAHSLASLKSRDEFKRQVDHHSRKIDELFGLKPVTFRNTELIYSDEIGEMVSEMGYKTVLTEGAKHILGWKSPNFVYKHRAYPDMRILLKNFQLSDDIAFRFSNRGWSEWPLTAEKYTHWLNSVGKKHQIINLFIDYETFGEHQWKDSGIFEFLKALPGFILTKTDYTFMKPSDIVKKYEPADSIEVPHPISWADEERDLTAWLGNEMQDEAFNKLYALEHKVKTIDDADIRKDWNYLQASDHFYYMCTKWFTDGDVHRYFNPYPSPYEAFINYMNVLSDFTLRVDEHGILDELDVLKEKAKDTFDSAKEFAKEATEAAKQKARETFGKVKAKARQTTEKARAKAKEEWDEVKDYTLEDIARMSNVKVKEFIKSVDVDELAYALRDAGDEIRNKVIPNLTKKARVQFDKIESEIKKIKKSDIKAFRDKIEQELKNLWK